MVYSNLVMPFKLVDGNIISFVVGGVQFVQSPPSTVYYPPPGFPGKTAVICATDTAANITWVEDESEALLNPITYNISRVSDRKSTMYITAAFIKSRPLVGINLLTTYFRCKAGAVTTRPFTFQKGGNACKQLCMYEYRQRIISSTLTFEMLYTRVT